MKTSSFYPRGVVIAFVSSIAMLCAAGSAPAQTSAHDIVGQWRSDTPLPNGVVQTFRFDTDGKFDLAMALAVDGTYRVDGSQLIETVTLPGGGVARTDTATFKVDGDSLVVNEHGGTPARVLHRSGAETAPRSIVGDWAIPLGTGMAAHYIFDPNGSMRVRAQVGGEQGRYEIRADTLHLSNNQTFQLPAIAQFVIANDVLTLTPADGKPPRHFHRVVPN